MKGSAAQLARMQGKLDQLAGILLYGSDLGLIHDRASTLVRTICGLHDDPFRLCVLPREQHARLLEECTARSLLGGRRVVRVADGADSLLPSLKRIAVATDAALIVVEAPGLAARSKLKAFAETAPDWMAVSCYPANGSALQADITRILAADQVDVTSDAVQFLMSGMPEDQLLRQAELATLAVYAGPGATLTLENVRDCIGSRLEGDIDDALYSVLAGHIRTADRSVSSLIAGDVSGPGILANLTYCLGRVLRARRSVESGLSADAAMRALSPPVFFQTQAVFADALRLWTVAELLDALRRARDADIACKRAASADLVIAAYLLTSLAQKADAARLKSSVGLRSAK